MPALLPEERDPRSGPPPWAALVERALTVAAQPDGRDGMGGMDRMDGTDGVPEAHLIPLLTPFLDVTQALLHERTSGLDLTGVVAAPALERGLRPGLGLRLARTAAPALVEELRRLRDAGQLAGSGPGERFSDFLRQLGDRHRLAGLMVDRPVLARLIGETCRHTAAAVDELVRRLVADRSDLVRQLLDAEPGPLVDLSLGAGDRHRGGRAVAVLTFADGSRVVYKPRPPGLLVRFGELLTWLGGHLPELAPRGVRVLARDGHGWTGFLPRRACRSAAEVELFYRRLGALLALLYVLDGTDMHCENIVADGAHPVLVDVETLLHPTWTSPTASGTDPAMAWLARSVARTAVLPSSLFGGEGPMDVSGICGDTGAPLPGSVERLEGAGTDAMRLVTGSRRFGEVRNRPRLDDAPVDPLDHVPALLSGFRAGYDTLVAHAGDLLADGGPLTGWADEELRVVARSTYVYDCALTEALRPDALVDAEARARTFAVLADPGPRQHLAPLVEHELADLRDNDIPVFTATATSRDLRTGSGVVLPDFLPRSGLEALRQKVFSLGAADRREQEWLIEATLAAKRPWSGHLDPAPLPTPPAPAPIDGWSVLSVVAGIGDELVARSRRAGERVNWPGLELVDGRAWSVLPMGAGLAEGYCGVALFLAELAAVSGRGRYAEVARLAVTGLPQLLGWLAAEPELARHVGSGGFAGLGGIAYAVARLSTLLGDETLAACLPEAVALVGLADDPDCGGVAEGTAGAVAALLAVHAECGLPAAAEQAERLAARLADPRGLSGGGFLHGTAGAAWARDRFADRFAGTGPGSSWWAEPVAAQSLSWCSGEAGALLAGLDVGAVDLTSAAVTAFVDAADRRLGSTDHSLCHGDGGVLEALVELAFAGHTGAAAVAGRGTARLLADVRHRGSRCGCPAGVFTPGLLRGAAGIGHALLRAGFGDRVPSVLLLRPGVVPAAEPPSPGPGDGALSPRPEPETQRGRLS